jgi:hypothetical protein
LYFFIGIPASLPSEFSLTPAGTKNPGHVNSKAVWEWNPRQTGSGNEPDLRGSLDGTTLVSAEACTSENPLGMADSRMRDTLEELSRMEGQKFHFVGTAGMAVRAGTKTRKVQWG